MRRSRVCINSSAMTITSMSKRSLSGIALLALAQAAAPGPTLTAHFECLWWSEAQMAQFDPNHPPAKATRVALKIWEYSDPVGVPHPDVVELVAEIRNDSKVRLEQ